MTEPANQPLPAAPGGIRTDHIRSFSGRRGHITSGQRQAYQQLSDRYCDHYQPSTIPIASLFNRPAPLIIEIGFGMGETTAVIARIKPDCNFLGLEVYPPGIGSLLRRIEDHQLHNVRIIHHDAFEVVRDMVPLDHLAGVHIFFPDPWPKARHHKRRLIQPAFVNMLARRLAVGGYLHCATDWQNYAEHMLDVLASEPLLRNTAEQFAPRPDYRPTTKFETRGVKLGHGVWDLVFKRVATDEQVLLTP